MEVGLIIQFGLLDGFTDESSSRKMQNSIDRIFGEGACEVVGIADVAFKSRCAFDESAMSGRKVIEDERLKSRFFEGFDGVTPDITGTTRNQDHEANPRK